MTTPQWPAPQAQGEPGTAPDQTTGTPPGDQPPAPATDPHGIPAQQGPAWPTAEPDGGSAPPWHAPNVQPPYPAYPPYGQRSYPMPYGHPYPSYPPPPYAQYPHLYGQPGPYPGRPAPAVATDEGPPWWVFLVSFVVAELVFLLASALVLVPFVIANPNLGQPGAPMPAPALLVAIAVPTLLAAALGIVVVRAFGGNPLRDLRLRFGWRDVGIGVLCGVIGVMVTIPVSALWANWVGEDRANSAVGELFEGLRMPPLLAVFVFVIVWLVAPFCEEVLYRGLLWRFMERLRLHRWLILGLTTVVFAFAHLELLRTPLLLVIGLPMGLARLFSGRLPAAIIAHQINNFLPALGLMLLLLGVPLTDS